MSARHKTGSDSGNRTLIDDYLNNVICRVRGVSGKTTGRNGPITNAFDPEGAIIDEQLIRIIVVACRYTWQCTMLLVAVMVFMYLTITTVQFGVALMNDYNDYLYEEMEEQVANERYVELPHCKDPAQRHYFERFGKRDCSNSMMKLTVGTPHQRAMARMWSESRVYALYLSTMGMFTNNLYVHIVIVLLAIRFAPSIVDYLVDTVMWVIPGR